MIGNDRSGDVDDKGGNGGWRVEAEVGGVVRRDVYNGALKYKHILLVLILIMHIFNLKSNLGK